MAAVLAECDIITESDVKIVILRQALMEVALFAAGC